MGGGLMPIKIMPEGEEFMRRLNRSHLLFPKKAERYLRWAVHRAKELTVENLKGKVLSKKTGRLAGSIREKVDARKAGRIVGLIWTDVVYAPAHEYGAKIKHPGSQARKAKALHFTYKGKEVFCKSTRPHSITLKPRPFMRPAARQAIRDGLDKIQNTWWEKR
jgi:phage gpG-like protein